MSWSDVVTAERLPAARPVSETEPLGVLPRLHDVAVRRADRPTLADQLAGLQRFLEADLGTFERAMASVPRGEARVQRAASHLLERGGKRLRPVCVMLAANLGRGFDGRALDLAVAAELVHNATLLHDDVVDHGEVRRGVPSAHTVFGNATSVFAGDWLLIEALKRVRRAGVGDSFGKLLDVIEEMILAESIQLDARGTLNLSKDDWFRVIEGKTSALFRWAMASGGEAGGLEATLCAALATFGAHLGVAFQAVDDLLDVCGVEADLGKELFVDLREGKMTWPLIVGFERDPSLRAFVEHILSQPERDDEAAATLVERLARTGALDDCQRMAEARVRTAIDALSPFPASDARSALVAAAWLAVERTR